MPTGEKVQNVVDSMLANDKYGKTVVNFHEDWALPYEIITENDAIMSVYLLTEEQFQEVSTTYLKQKFRGVSYEYQ